MISEVNGGYGLKLQALKSYMVDELQAMQRVRAEKMRVKGETLNMH